MIKVALKDSMGSDLSVVNAARVSFDKEHEYVKTGDTKLIKYLADNNHWSPFAHTSVQFRIKAPIFVARQLAKHQVGLSWNEISRRYVDQEPEFYYPKQWRGKPVDKKQGSSEEIIDINPVTKSGSAMVDDYHHAIKSAYGPTIIFYTKALHLRWQGWSYPRVCLLSGTGQVLSMLSPGFVSSVWVKMPKRKPVRLRL